PLHAEQVVADAFEARIGSDLDGDVEVPRDTAARRRRAASRQAETLAVVDARRDVDVDRARRAHPAVAAAVAARRGNATPGRAAGDAGRGGDDLPENRATNLAHLTGTAAHVAARRVRTRFTTRAFTTRARDR